MKESIQKTKQLAKTIQESGRNQMVGFVDNRGSCEFQKNAVKSIQKKQNVIQRDIPEALEVWRTLPHSGAIPPMTFESVVKTENKKLIDAWNAGRSHDVDPYYINPGDKSDKFSQNREAWKGKKANTPLEKAMKEMHTDLPITHEVAFIGRDTFAERKTQKEALLQNVKAQIEATGVAPLTLTSFLRDNDAEFSQRNNTRFIDIIISTRTPVVFPREFDIPHCKDKGSLTQVGNTSEEVIYLLQHGYEVQENKLVPPDKKGVSTDGKASSPSSAAAAPSQISGSSEKKE